MLLYCEFKEHYLPHGAPPLLVPLTSPFENFNRTTFTTHYIKKAAATFTLNRGLLMQNAHFCFNKLLFINLSRLLQFRHKKDYRAAKYFQKLPFRKLKKIEKHWYKDLLFFPERLHLLCR